MIPLSRNFVVGSNLVATVKLSLEWLSDPISTQDYNANKRDINYLVWVESRASFQFRFSFHWKELSRVARLQSSSFSFCTIIISMAVILLSFSLRLEPMMLWHTARHLCYDLQSISLMGWLGEMVILSWNECWRGRIMTIVWGVDIAASGLAKWIRRTDQRTLRIRRLSSFATSPIICFNSQIIQLGLEGNMASKLIARIRVPKDGVNHRRRICTLPRLTQVSWAE